MIEHFKEGFMKCAEEQIDKDQKWRKARASALASGTMGAIAGLGMGALSNLNRSLILKKILKDAIKKGVIGSAAGAGIGGLMGLALGKAQEIDSSGFRVKITDK